MKKFLIGGAAVAAILAGGAAFAQTVQPAPAAPKGHHRHGGQPVDRTEVQARVDKVFAKLDANHDGFISRDELNAVQERRQQAAEQRAQKFDPSKMFDRMDLNHDGKITQAEAQQAKSQHAEAKPGHPARAQATGVGRLFERFDGDKDGVITRAEFDVKGQQMKARMQKAGAPRGMHMVDDADLNKDGRISRAEMEQSALARFDRMDLNHDGKISPDERKQGRKLKGQNRPS
jgi:Ca2+-binding EF-hand superfamily protein